jgi:DNA-directed RNA polymerase specialized sigma subunit
MTSPQQGYQPVQRHMSRRNGKIAAELLPPLDELLRLYVEENMTLKEIGQKFDLSHSAVSNQLNKHPQYELVRRKSGPRAGRPRL